MKWSQFAVCNLFASIGFALSVAATAYGLGRVTTGHHSSTDILILVAGVVIGAVLVWVFVRRYRQHALTLESPSA
jgi:membrane protein DedA with SNARE-associated domain